MQLDRHYSFPEGNTVTVDGTTAAILKCSRFKDDFDFNKAPCCVSTTAVSSVVRF